MKNLSLLLILFMGALLFENLSGQCLSDSIEYYTKIDSSGNYFKTSVLINQRNLKGELDEQHWFLINPLTNKRFLNEIESYTYANNRIVLRKHAVWNTTLAKFLPTQEITYYYDNSGFLLLQIITDETYLSNRISKTYNTQGDIIQEVYENWANSLNSWQVSFSVTTSYEYNFSNLISKKYQTVDYGNGNLHAIRRICNNYNSTNEIMDESYIYKSSLNPLDTSFGVNGFAGYLRKYQYFSNGLLDKVIYYDINNFNTSFVEKEYKYDALNRITELNTGDYTEKYSYNNQGYTIIHENKGESYSIEYYNCETLKTIDHPIDKLEAWIIYPTEIHNSFQIHSKIIIQNDIYLSLTDMQGKIQYKSKASLSGNQDMHVELPILNSGIYILTIINNKMKISKKIIIQ